MALEVLTRDPATYRLQQQLEDYAWKIQFIAEDFVTRAELRALVEELMIIFRAHLHVDSEGKNTTPPVTQPPDPQSDKPPLAAGVVSSKEPNKVAANTIPPLPI